VSSDGNGSLPVFDKKGQLVGLTIATPSTLLKKFQSLVRRGLIRLDQAARLFSTNPARFYKLDGKGAIAEGGDADLVLVDEGLTLRTVIGRGRVLMHEGRVLAKGTFSPP
jgi:beta-aspartyl-dipeptidase (metallo-type)